MISLLLLAGFASLTATARKRKEETTTLLIIEGPLHAITSNPTTSFETMTSSRPVTQPPTPSHLSLATRTPPFITEQPVTNKVFSAENVEVVAPDLKGTNFTFRYSSMSPLPSPSHSSTQHLPLPNTTLTHFPNTTHLPSQHNTTRADLVTTKQDHVTTKQDHVTTTHDLVTSTHHVTTRSGYNVTTQPENGTEEEDNNNTVLECEECALARPLGYLISCLVVVGVLINLLCYLHFLRRVNGVTGNLSDM